MNELIQKLLATGISQLIKNLDAEQIKNFIDAGLDAIENKQIVGEVDTPKEQLIAGIIATIRKILNIDDKKYGSDKEQ